jgi:hypothetical protein
MMTKRRLLTTRSLPEVVMQSLLYRVVQLSMLSILVSAAGCHDDIDSDQGIQVIDDTVADTALPDTVDTTVTDTGTEETDTGPGDTTLEDTGPGDTWIEDTVGCSAPGGPGNLRCLIPRCTTDSSI